MKDSTSQQAKLRRRFGQTGLSASFSVLLLLRLHILRQTETPTDIRTSLYQRQKLSSGCVVRGHVVRDFAPTCEAALDIPTRLWNPLEAMKQHAGLDIRPVHSEVEATLDEWGDTLAVTLGAGLNALQSTVEVSLLPKEDS